jgi:alpha-glucoside transport system substrate-binding protein
MTVSITRAWRAVALGLSAILIAGACTTPAATSPSPSASAGASASASASPGGKIGGTLVIWTAWGGEELKTFQNVIKPFADKTGVDVRLTTVRSEEQLAINVQAGTQLPDISGPPSPDKKKDWAAKGVMKPLESFLDMTAYLRDTYPSLTTCSSGDCEFTGILGGKHYQLVVKTQVKGVWWYNTKTFKGDAPKTWDDLLKVPVSGNTKLFCVGLESADASGWPATDMIENIVMRQSGADVYNKWIAGTQKWTSPEIKKAFQAFGQTVTPANVYGGPTTVLSTNFGRAGKPLFANPPGCMFLEQATFITNFFKEDYPNIKSGQDFDIFPHPSFDAANAGNVEGAFDSFVMYNDTPQARAFMSYLATAEAQTTFVASGGTLAANKTVTNFPDAVFKKANDMIASAKNILPDASDAMPADMNKAFWRATLDYTKDQSKLDSILANLDRVQADAYKK